MNKADEKVRAALDHNFKEQLEYGPGMRYSTRVAVAAKCKTGKHVLLTGLGCMGVGSMWGYAKDHRSPEALADIWDDLRIEQCSAFGILEEDVCR